MRKSVQNFSLRNPLLIGLNFRIISRKRAQKLRNNRTYQLRGNLDSDKISGAATRWLFTRLLRAALNISWRQHTTNKELYGDLPRVSTTLRERRLRFSGHCWRSKAEVIPKLLFWQPTQGRRSRGRPAQTYIDQMERDTGLLRTEIPTIMEDRKEWKDLILNVRARSIQQQQQSSSWSSLLLALFYFLEFGFRFFPERFALSLRMEVVCSWTYDFSN